jgi:type I restriction enzyme S subunit
MARAWCATIKTDGISQSNISGSKLATFPFPLPPTKEQVKIAHVTNTMLGILDELEARLIDVFNTHIAFTAAAVHYLDA